MSNNYVYYQPNELDKHDIYGDCTIRALSKVFNCSWKEAFKKQIPYCLKYQVTSAFDCLTNCPTKQAKAILKELGFEYHSIKVSKGSKRPTVESFTKEHTTGRYIVNVARHVVAVVDGKYYDTWDSGDKCLYGFYELVS